MNIRIGTDADAIDREQWERFVYDHPQGNVFQSPQMFAAYGAAKNYKPVVVTCHEGENITGILLAVVQHEYKGFLGALSARSIIWGGPLVKDNDTHILAAILKEYDRVIKKKAIYTQVRNIFNMDWAKNVMETPGYIYEAHLNILIDLEKSEEQLWNGIHSKRRNEIRRAAKEGTCCTDLTEVDALEKCWPILCDVYQRARLPLPDISLFKGLLENKPESSCLKIFAAQNNGKIVGTLLALCWRERVLDWYAGAYQESLPKYPNDVLPWEAMLWAKRNGYKTFDFGGAGKPGIVYGVRDFKLKFGGELMDFGRFQKIHRPVLMKIATTGFKIWRWVKGMR
jgi:lipid II:glycine glycyltransferase (peptidoglycan interpeptide bridge formation enzyme)